MIPFDFIYACGVGDILNVTTEDSAEFFVKSPFTAFTRYLYCVPSVTEPSTYSVVVKPVFTAFQLLSHFFVDGL